MDRMKKLFKHPLKSKTNWAQVPFIALFLASFKYPEIRKAFCEKGDIILLVQVGLTIFARNYMSNLTFKRRKS